ncbi:MAG: hypothetical protein VX404_00140 [Planctomycetota bacterium]|nr:hypothetical protein [Planctomycetota bacterium]
MGRRRDELSLFEMLKDHRRGGDQFESDGSVESSQERIPDPSEAMTPGGVRRKVSLDDPAKSIPSSRRLPSIPEGASSDSPGGHGVPSSPTGSFLSAVIEIRISTILVFTLAAVVAIAVAFISGRQMAVSVPEGRIEMAGGDVPPWPVLNPEPEPKPAIRNVEQDGVVDVSSPIVEGEAVTAAPVIVEMVPKTLWSVMIGQHLSKDPQVIDQLVQYVDSGLSSSSARIRVSNSRGARTFNVFVGPFEQQEQARSALREIQTLRPHLGVRFRDAYPTRMVFSVEELEKYGSGN